MMHTNDALKPIVFTNHGGARIHAQPLSQREAEQPKEAPDGEKMHAPRQPDRRLHRQLTPKISIQYDDLFDK